MRPKIKKITLCIGALILALSSFSCQAVEEAGTGKLVYLRVEKVVASSFDESPDWAPRPDAMAVVDGNMETRWSSGYTEGEWIYLDLGKPKTISRLVIKWEQAYATDFDILTSDDAARWKNLFSLKSQNPDWGISMWEIEPYGPEAQNPGELPKEEIFKSSEEKAELENKRKELLKKIEGQIVASPGPIKQEEFQKGVNYTSWRSDELAGDLSDYSLIYLSQLGVKHIALMAVWYQADAASKKIYTDPEKTTNDESLGHAINMMHALGMKVMLKPHVDLADEEARTNIIPSAAWFSSYKEFILHYARFAAKYNAELLCIGTELSNTSIARWRAQWLDIIAAIRAVYKGKITYAANWDEYDTVSFWPEVDFIGMDAYFPLTDKTNPTKEEVIQGWGKNADVIEAWLKANNLSKSVIFTEVGYDTIEGSNKQPWRVLPTMAKYKEDQDEQANCLEALFLALSKRPWFKGFYWWNYFPRPDIGPLGYTLRGKKGEKILSEWFKTLK
ncbi:MAG: discoidin domain-containing protein [Candidatus Omnitrophica bacterium]|nr:discoidin domain-containing protein [Candidatus Omnitrophota bacterium]